MSAQNSKSKALWVTRFSFAFFVLSFTLVPYIASAQSEQSIRTLLCAPREDNSAPASSDLVGCINRLYRFVVAIAAVSAVLLLAWAGYLYMFGGEESVTTAKAMMGSTIAGIIIILTTFIFLRQINPDIVKFKPIQPQDLPFSSSNIRIDCSKIDPSQRAAFPGCAGTGTNLNGGQQTTCKNDLYFLNPEGAEDRGSPTVIVGTTGWKVVAKIDPCPTEDKKYNVRVTIIGTDDKGEEGFKTTYFSQSDVDPKSGYSNTEKIGFTKALKYTYYLDYQAIGREDDFTNIKSAVITAEPRRTR